MSLLPFTFFLALAANQEDPAQELKGHVETLASDGLGGRCAGTAGSEKASTYLVAQFEKLGLKAPEGGYLHLFDIGSYLDPRKKIRSSNVVGILEGDDVQLRKEYVVVGAHYDGVGQTGDPNEVVRLEGTDAEDRIWNGADDNASGVAILLEAARILIAQKRKRSILFVAFGAEEFGNVGSKKFVQNVPFPASLNQIVGMVNLHMLGRKHERPLEVFSASSSAGWKAVLDRAAQGTMEIRISGENPRSGDHAGFIDRKVPAIMLFGGFHQDYHTPDDEADKVDGRILVERTRFVVRLISELADLEGRLMWTGPPPPLPLGLEGTDISDQEAENLKLSKGSGGVRVLDVFPDSNASRAGIRSGDVLIRFGPFKLPRDGALAALRKAIQSTQSEKTVAVLVFREGKRLELEVVWSPR